MLEQGISIATFALLVAAPVAAEPVKQQQPGGPWVPLLVVVLCLCSFVALEIVLWVLAPEPLTATCRAISRGRGRCLLTGLFLVALAALLVYLLGHWKGAGEALGALALGIVALGLLIGLTAIGALLGQGVVAMSGRSGHRAWEVLIGSILLGLAVLFPILGQVLGIYFALVGLGGVVMALAATGGTRK